MLIHVLNSILDKVYAGQKSILQSCFAGWLFIFLAVPAFATPLDDYVNASDTSYNYNIINTTYGTGYTLYTVAMTSQTWRNPLEVDHNAWQHNMRICVPNIITSDKALLTIGGGIHGSVPTVNTDLTGWYGSVDTNLAVSTGSVVAAIANVPNQPLLFAGTGESPRMEDAIIANTGRLYLDGGDVNWPALLPMVKSAARAMDTISSVASGEGVGVNEFVLTGQSKRGMDKLALPPPSTIACVPSSRR